MASHDSESNLVPLMTRRHALIMVCLFAMLTGLYWFTYSGTIISTDEFALFDGTESLVRRQNTMVNYSFNQFSVRDFSVAQQPNTPLVDAEPMQMIAAGVLFWLANVLPGIGIVHTVWLLNVLLCAAGGSLLFLYARVQSYSERVGIAAGLLYGVGTIAWPYSKVFFREPLAMVLLFAAALSLHVWRVRWGSWRGWPWFAGFLLFFLMGLLTKEAALLSIPIYLMLALPGFAIQGRARQIGKIALITVAMVAAIVLLLNLLLTVIDVPRAYNPFERLAAIQGKTEFIGYALLSYLFSPGRSLFVFSPVLLLAIPGMAMLIRERRWRDALLPVLAVSVFVIGYAVVRHEHWYGGLSWGPRYLVPGTLFGMLAVLPVLRAFEQRGLALWARVGVLALSGFSVWAQLIAVIPAQHVYFDELARRGVIAWQAGTWQLQHAPLIVNPPLILRSPVDFAWLRVPGRGLFLPISAGMLIIGAGYMLWLALRQRIHRVGLMSAVGLVGVLVSLCVGLLAIYPDPEYFGDQAKLHDLLASFEEQRQPDDILVLSNPDNQRYFLNYFKDSDVLLYTLAESPGEQPSPEQSPAVSNTNPDVLLESRQALFLMNLPEYTGRVWLFNNSGPFTGYTVRPVEWFMARHFFPLQSFQTDETARLILFSVDHDAPADQAAFWPSQPLDARFGTQLMLEGYDIPSARPLEGEAAAVEQNLSPGDVVPVSLVWRALEVPESDYSVGIFLLNSDGMVVAQRDGAPQTGFKPFNTWREGETVRDNHGLQLPSELAPGQYKLWVKVYAWQTGEALPVVGDNSTADGEAALLATLSVAP